MPVMYKCQFCDSLFPRRDNLIRHYNRKFRCNEKHFVKVLDYKDEDENSEDIKNTENNIFLNENIQVIKLDDNNEADINLTNTIQTNEVLDNNNTTIEEHIEDINPTEAIKEIAVLDNNITTIEAQFEDINLTEKKQEIEVLDHIITTIEAQFEAEDINLTEKKQEIEVLDPIITTIEEKKIHKKNINSTEIEPKKNENRVIIMTDINNENNDKSNIIKVEKSEEIILTNDDNNINVLDKIITDHISDTTENKNDINVLDKINNQNDTTENKTDIDVLDKNITQKEQIILKNTFDNTKWRENLMKEWNEAKAEYNKGIKNEVKLLEEKILQEKNTPLEEITDLPKENYNHEPFIFNEYETAKMYLNSLNKNKRQKTERKINIKHYSKEDKANMLINGRNKFKKINFTPLPIKRNLRKSKKNIE